MTADPREIAKFAKDAHRWWDPDGPFAPLHKLNPTRMAHLREEIGAHFGRDGDSLHSLAGLRILDVGCGGGLVSAPLARMGARVTGVDADEEGVSAARAYAHDHGLDIDLRHQTTQDLIAEGAHFDAVLALEIVEHVSDRARFIGDLAALAKPGGLVLFSTINRTLKALALAKLAAEYVLRWVPAGTHDPRLFVPPAVLAEESRAAGLEPDAPVGLVYRPFADRFELSRDVSVNYFLTARKPLNACPHPPAHRAAA